jgi:DNA-binding NtrC family response regulator
MRAHRVLVVDDDRLLGAAVADALRPGGLSVRCVHTAADARLAVAETSFDVIVLDQQLPDGEGAALCPELLAANAGAKIIFVTAFPSYEHAVRALRAGAWDYRSKPFELDELVRTVTRALGTSRLERAERLSALQQGDAGARSLAGVEALVAAAAPTDAPVLITGETGTGKNRVARAIHQASHRRDGPWVTVNCAAMPEHLIEAELFGWEKGAFTGAVGAREGLLELAEGGTLVLDEIGEMPPHLQSKLLTVLEDREVRRLGGRAARPLDVRIIAATNADLDQRVERGAFRADLFYRLNVVRIALPPLRERVGDLPALCADLLAQLRPGATPPVLGPGELERLAAYPWPGNVRELRNVLERALILHGARPRPSELVAAPVRSSPTPPPRVVPVANDDEDLDLGRAERRLIARALARTEGNLTAAARLLGLSLSTLKRRLKAPGGERFSVTSEEVRLNGSE